MWQEPMVCSASSLTVWIRRSWMLQVCVWWVSLGKNLRVSALSTSACDSCPIVRVQSFLCVLRVSPAGVGGCLHLYVACRLPSTSFH